MLAIAMSMNAVVFSVVTFDSLKSVSKACSLKQHFNRPAIYLKERVNEPHIVTAQVGGSRMHYAYHIRSCMADAVLQRYSMSGQSQFALCQLGPNRLQRGKTTSASALQSWRPLGSGKL
jgi:hypothetical protein